MAKLNIVAEVNKMEDVFEGISTRALRKKATALGLDTKKLSREELYKCMLDYYDKENMENVEVLEPVAERNSCLTLFNKVVELREKIITENELIQETKIKLTQLLNAQTSDIQDLKLATTSLFSEKFIFRTKDDVEDFLNLVKKMK